MLRNKYSPELATGVISASGTLGQIIPPSIVIIILGTLAGDIYSTAQETRAQSVGCFDALTCPCWINVYDTHKQITIALYSFNSSANQLMSNSNGIPIPIEISALVNIL